MQTIIWLFLIFALNIEATEKRIIAGKPAKLGEFPFQVSLRRSYNDQHFCGGSIITSNYILTAAHCMFYFWGGVLSTSILSAIAGQIILNTNNATIFRNASEIFIHPNYNHTNEITNDIALIKLTENLPVDNKIIKTIELSSFTPKTSCFVTGWGVQSYDSQEISNKLLVAEVSIFNFSVCKNKYNKINVSFSDGLICAGGNTEKMGDSCQGDSGGPLVCNNKLAGVVASGKGCGDVEFPGIYTDVAYFIPWIESIVGVSETTEDEFEENSTVDYLPSSKSNSANYVKLSIILIVFSIIVYF